MLDEHFKEPSLRKNLRETRPVAVLSRDLKI
jgi:hypothetical protein